jgi:ribosomal protein L7/L12
VGCVINIATADLAGRERPNRSDPLSYLPIILPLLDVIVLTGLLNVSWKLGWQRTRTFWVILVVSSVICWLAGDLLPALWATKYPGWAASLTWLGPAVVGLALAAFVAPNPQRLAKVWLPIEALVRQPGIVATAIVGTALSIRTGLVAYSLPYAKHGTRQRTELQHFPAPAEFLQQKNPFDEPQFCVVLEQVGEEPDAVRDIIRAAVANRSSQHAADLVRQSPIVIREAADRVSADALVAKLRAVGATATVRDAIDWFVESIAIDRATPI